MEKNRSQENAGGNDKGLSIVIEGDNKKFVAELSDTLAKKLTTRNKKVITEAALRAPEENVLAANQYLLEATAAPLEPATLSLLVVVKLRGRLRRVQIAKGEGFYVISNTSWLGDTYYYGARGKNEVSKQIIVDCGLMRPDVWVVIDEPHGLYARLAKQAGVRVYSPKLAKNKLVDALLEHIDYAEKKKPERPVQEFAKPEKKDKKVEPESADTIAISELALNRLFVSHPDLKLSPKSPEKVDYYLPEHVGAKVLGAYKTIMGKIIANHEELTKKLGDNLKSADKAKKLTASMLPLAALVNVGYAPDMLQEINDDLPELLKIVGGKQLPQKANKLTELLDSNLKSTIDDDATAGTKLISYHPKNEMELATWIAYEQTTRSNKGLSEDLGETSISVKESIIETYLESDPNLASLNDVEYGFEILADFSAFREIRRQVKAGIILQEFTPRYGYDMPSEIEEAGLVDLYEQAFDLSLELHSLLQAAGFEKESQYAVLQGHRFRFHMNLSANSLKTLLSAQNIRIKSISEQIKEQVGSVHPLLSAKFYK